MTENQHKLTTEEKELIQSLLNQYKSWDDDLEQEDVKDINDRVDRISKKLNLTTEETDES